MVGSLSSQYEILAKECEDAIRAGKIAHAARKLNGLTYSQVPREWRLTLAKLSRRAGLFTSGLKLLKPIVRASDRGFKVTPSAEELAEYGACLQINGSLREAIEVLDNVPFEQVPDALLYRAWCHFNRWEYDQAVPFLDRYVKSEIPSYWKLTGSVNLAAALAMMKDHDWALEVIAFALTEAQNGGLVRLQANCLELRAQVYLQSDRVSLAEPDLSEALRLLGLAKVQETLFIRKWQAVIEANRTKSTKPFLNLKTEAKKLSRWEVDREADLFSLKLNFDQSQFEYLLFGTPYPAYQKRIVSELQTHNFSSHTLIGEKQWPCLEIESGEIDGKSLFKPGSKTHQVLEVLLRDFYRPAGVGGLFAELFPGESFDIFSSPGRIHQMIKRTRKSLAESNLPLQLSETKGRYSLIRSGPLSFKVPLIKQKVDWCLIHFNKLLKKCDPNKKMTAGEIKSTLAVTQDEYRRFCEWAIEERLLYRVYDGSLPLYGFTEKIANGRAAS